MTPKTESNPTEKLDHGTNPVQSVSSAALKITDLVQKASLIRLSQLLGNKAEFHLRESASTHSALLGHWVSILLIAGPEFRLILKIFYDSLSIQSLAGEELKNDKYKGRIESFVRIYCAHLNQLINACLERQEIRSGYCPAVITRGFDEVFFHSSSYPKLTESCWTLNKGSLGLTFTFSFEVIDTTVLKKLRKLPNDLEIFTNVVDLVLAK